MRKFQDQLLIKELCPTEDSARYNYSNVWGWRAVSVLTGAKVSLDQEQGRLQILPHWVFSHNQLEFGWFLGESPQMLTFNVFVHKIWLVALCSIFIPVCQMFQNSWNCAVVHVLLDLDAAVTSLLTLYICTLTSSSTCLLVSKELAFLMHVLYDVYECWSGAL